MTPSFDSFIKGKIAETGVKKKKEKKGAGYGLPLSME
jgi:hypothetical protein